MNVPATVPCAVTADTVASTDGARQTVMGFLFALVLGDLLEAGTHPQTEKKHEDSVHGANVAALIPVPVPAPMPLRIAVAEIAGQTCKAAFSEEAADAESAPEAPAAAADVTGDFEQVTLRDPSPDFAARIAPAESTGQQGETPLPAGLVLEPVQAERTVRAPASGESVPAAPVDVEHPIQEILELSTEGNAQWQQPAPANFNAARGEAPARAPVPDIATPGWTSSLFPAMFTAERASGVPSVSLLELAGPKRAPVAAPPSASMPVANADLRTQPVSNADLAFAARLSPLDRQAAPALGAAAQDKSIAPQAEAPVAPLPHAEMDVNRARREAPAGGPENAPKRAAHANADLVPDANPPVRDAESPAPANGARVTDIFAVASPARFPHASSVAQPNRAAATAPPEPAPSSAPAREIRVQVSGGEQRVDVRLTEHRGEVQVAVRTPDSRLIEALRGDLPALSARLEQNGFRAETWHPAVSRPEHPSLAPEASSTGSAPQGHGGERHGNPQDHEPARRAPLPEGRAESPPPEFAWLLSSLG